MCGALGGAGGLVFFFFSLFGGKLTVQRLTLKTPGLTGRSKCFAHITTSDSLRSCLSTRCQLLPLNGNPLAYIVLECSWRLVTSNRCSRQHRFATVLCNVNGKRAARSPLTDFPARRCQEPFILLSVLH